MRDWPTRPLNTPPPNSLVLVMTMAEAPAWEASWACEKGELAVGRSEEHATNLELERAVATHDQGDAASGQAGEVGLVAAEAGNAEDGGLGDLAASAALEDLVVGAVLEGVGRGEGLGELGLGEELPLDKGEVLQRDEQVGALPQLADHVLHRTLVAHRAGCTVAARGEGDLLETFLRKSWRNQEEDEDSNPQPRSGEQSTGEDGRDGARAPLA